MSIERQNLGKDSKGRVSSVNGSIGGAAESFEQEEYAVFWDIENCPVPKAVSAYQAAQSVRRMLNESGCRKELSFRCYANISSVPVPVQEGLSLANVEIVHVVDKKPGAADRAIFLALDRFERSSRDGQAPAKIVLITGDVDFIGKVHDLVHQAGHHVTVVVNKVAKHELRNAASRCVTWSDVLSAASSSSVTATATATSTASKRNGVQVPEHPSRAAIASSSAANTVKSSKPQHAPQSTTHLVLKGGPSVAPVVVVGCSDCGRTFNSDVARRQHLSATNHKCSCPSCPKTFANVHSLETHQESTGHTFEAYSRAAVSHSSTRKHRKAKGGEFACMECDRVFASPQALNQHQTATGHCNGDDDEVDGAHEPLIPCPQCNRAFHSVNAVHQHQDDANHLFECEVCSSHFFTSNDLHRHQATFDHLQTCPGCSKAFETIAKLEDHIARVGHFYKCTRCQAPYASKRAFEAHTRTCSHVDQSLQPVRCGECRSVFPSMESFVRHKRLSMCKPAVSEPSSQQSTQGTQGTPQMGAPEFSRMQSLSTNARVSSSSSSSPSAGDARASVDRAPSSGSSSGSTQMRFLQGILGGMLSPLVSLVQSQASPTRPKACSECGASFYLDSELQDHLLAHRVQNGYDS
eukprot:ANDGO_05724.mRNA.1 Protein suppressor of hairy wing